MRSTLLLLTAAAAVAAGGTSAEAAFIPAFTDPSPSTVGDINLRYAVYQTEMGNWASELGIVPTGRVNISDGPSDIDTGSKFVYFYQVENNGSTDVRGLDIIQPPAPVTFTGDIYTSAGFLRTRDRQALPGSVNGTRGPSLTSQGATLAYDFGRITTAATRIFFATSDSAPVFSAATVDVFGTGPMGGFMAPVAAVQAVPEPGSMALFALFGLCGGGVTLRRRKAAAV